MEISILLAKQNTFMGQHLLIPKEGVAIHINAYNFPVWGMLEKIEVNLLAGMPAVVKPATVTSYLTEAVVKEIIRSQILPEGALQLICGSAAGLLDHVDRSGCDHIYWFCYYWYAFKIVSQSFIRKCSVYYGSRFIKCDCIGRRRRT
jgi:hypothetical protein